MVTNFVYKTKGKLVNIEKVKLRIVDYKFLYTIIIVLIYLLGKSIPLMGVDISAYANKTVDMEKVFIQSISGDINRCSVLALGISPYMLAGIIVQMVAACRRADDKSKVSPKKMNRFTLAFTLVFAIVFAIFRMFGLEFAVTGRELVIDKVVAVFEMVAGAMLILWLADRNKQFGIGGQTALIFINIIDGIMATLFRGEALKMALAVFLGLLSMIIMIVMENSEKRIHVQRVSIHNIYSDKNYIAIKLNPIGVMPAMFSTAFFMIPQVLTKALAAMFTGNAKLQWMERNMTMTKPLGVVVYIMILYVLTIVFSILFISPRDMTENLLKSGDCIPGLHAGVDTKRYIMRILVRLGMVSATVMSICLGIPMILQLYGLLEGALVMLPTSMMMLTGITCNLRDEIIALRNLDAYEPFI